MQEPIGVPQIYLEKEIVKKNTVEEKQCLRPIVMLGISRKVPEAKE